MLSFATYRHYRLIGGVRGETVEIDTSRNAELVISKALEDKYTDDDNRIHDVRGHQNGVWTLRAYSSGNGG